MSKILFICQANVGRSQIAEAYYNYFTKSKDAVSAGNVADIEKRYPKVPDRIADLMKEEGIDMSGQKPKCVWPDLVDKCRTMYVLCKPAECLAFVSSSKKAVFWEIEDPEYMTEDQIRIIRDKIKEKVLSII